jgi:hypothetical protein
MKNKLEKLDIFFTSFFQSKKSDKITAAILWIIGVYLLVLTIIIIATK